MTEVRLFNTCLGEDFFPAVSIAVETVLRRLGLRVTSVTSAFCCGQVAFNEGLRDEARDLALRFLGSAEPGIPIIVPSGSCASMLKIFYRDLFADDSGNAAKAAALGPWIWEFSEFIVNQLGVTDLGARFPHRVAYHPSCHLMRELNLREEPIRLLRSVRDLTLCELKNSDECCGFGGLFSVKFPHISSAMLDDKLRCISESGAEVVVANDAGCLMQIGGGLHRQRITIETRHLAEVLASR